MQAFHIKMGLLTLTMRQDQIELLRQNENIYWCFYGIIRNCLWLFRDSDSIRATLTSSYVCV